MGQQNGMAAKRRVQALAKKFSKKLKKIKVFLCDVDGILTDGRLAWAGEAAGFNRFFHALDGLGFRILQKNGIKVGVISGGQSEGLKMRAQMLKMDYYFVGNEDKRGPFLKILSDGYQPDEILFMGDDFIDLPILKQAGFAATVPEASWEIQAAVDYVTQRSMGQGCVREVIDILRTAQKLNIDFPDFAQ
ncbi:MAG: HAD hydrolase family protein [Bacteriovoracaceae bacterium]|nr:HAD hydrolase family protein [Bacteriovoracaceae bacterium]